MGPTVWELEGPMPILKISKTLVDIFRREKGSKGAREQGSREARERGSEGARELERNTSI
jgi:hypothetical protein